jgi:hypothetical protein
VKSLNFKKKKGWLLAIQGVVVDTSFFPPKLNRVNNKIDCSLSRVLCLFSIHFPSFAETRTALITGVFEK